MINVQFNESTKQINEQEQEILADSPRVDDNLLKTLERAEGVAACQHNFNAKLKGTADEVGVTLSEINFLLFDTQLG